MGLIGFVALVKQFVLTRVGFISSSDMAQKEVLCEITVHFHTYQSVSSFPF